MMQGWCTCMVLILYESNTLLHFHPLSCLFSSIAVSDLEAWTLNQAVGLFLLISSCLYFSSHFCFSDNSTFRAISATNFSFFPAKKDNSTCLTVYCRNIQLFHLRHLVAFQKCNKIPNFPNMPLVALKQSFDVFHRSKFHTLPELACNI